MSFIAQTKKQLLFVSPSSIEGAGAFTLLLSPIFISTFATPQSGCSVLYILAQQIIHCFLTAAKKRTAVKVWRQYEKIRIQYLAALGYKGTAATWNNELAQMMSEFSDHTSLTSPGSYGK